MRPCVGSRIRNKGRTSSSLLSTLPGSVEDQQMGSDDDPQHAIAGKPARRKVPPIPVLHSIAAEGKAMPFESGPCQINRQKSEPTVPANETGQEASELSCVGFQWSIVSSIPIERTSAFSPLSPLTSANHTLGHSDRVTNASCTSHLSNYKRV